MADYPGSNSESTMQGDLKEKYSKPKRFKKLKKMLTGVAK